MFDVCTLGHTTHIQAVVYHNSQTAAHKTLSALESPFSLRNIMDREKEE
jgi:hypothetical protein